MTPMMREALTLIADRTDQKSPDPGVMCSDATFADTYNAFVNWRTAQALHRAGLVVYPYTGSGWEGDNTSIALTEDGWAVLGRPAPGEEGSTCPGCTGDPAEHPADTMRWTPGEIGGAS